jgi:hypothetical protein
MRDFFQQVGCGWLHDPMLLDRLVAEKLEREAHVVLEMIENRDRFSLRPHLPSRSPSRARSARLFSNQIDHSAQPGGHMLTSGIIERQAWKRRCPFF